MVILWGQGWHNNWKKFSQEFHSQTLPFPLSAILKQLSWASVSLSQSIYVHILIMCACVCLFMYTYYIHMQMTLTMMTLCLQHPPSSVINKNKTRGEHVTVFLQKHFNLQFVWSTWYHFVLLQMRNEERKIVSGRINWHKTYVRSENNSRK